MDQLPAPQTAPDIPDIIRRYRNGESLADLAKEHRKHIATLYRWMMKELGPDYHEMQTDMMIDQVAESYQVIKEAYTPCEVAKGQALAKLSTLILERRRPKLFGPKQEVQTDTKVEIVLRNQPIIIDHPPRQPEQSDQTEVERDRSEPLDK